MAKLKYHNGSEWEQLAPTMEEFNQEKTRVDEHLAENVTEAHGFEYEEGVFTPTIKFGGNSDGVTYSLQNGRYTKIGRMIHFQIEMALSDKGTSTGTMTIDGLPYASVSGSPSTLHLPQMTRVSYPTNAQEIILRQQRGLASVSPRFIVSGGNVVLLNDTHVRNTTEVMITGSYAV